MSLCGEDTLRNDSTAGVCTATMLCNAWSCETCRPRRRARLMAEAASGEPKRFITLTISPRVGSSPEERRAIMGKALSRLAQKLRRRWGRKSFEYFVVCEAHESGEPHLHICQRGRYIPQPVLSKLWQALTGGRVVHIRKVDNTDAAVKYVAKYVSKKPEQFGFAKRYWQSRGYQLHRRPKTESPLPADGRTYRAGMSPAAMAQVLTLQCYAGRRLNDRWLFWQQISGRSPGRGSSP